MKLENLLNITDDSVFPAPRVTEIFMAVCLIGVALLKKNEAHDTWWFDIFIVTAGLQLCSVSLPLLKKIKHPDEHLCRMFAALSTIGLVGAYFITAASELGLGAWVLGVSFVGYTTLLAARLAVVIMKDGTRADNTISRGPNQGSRGSSNSTHPLHSIYEMGVSQDASSTALEQSRTITG